MAASSLLTKTSAAVGTTRTKVGMYSVPSSRVAVVIGATVTNILSSACLATVEYSPNGTDFLAVVKNISLQPGETLAPLAALGKIAIPATGSIHVTSGTASGLDVVMSILEKDA